MFMKVDLIQVSCDAIKLITSLIMPHLVLRSTLSTKSSHRAATLLRRNVSQMSHAHDCVCFQFEPNSGRVTLVFVSANGKFY